MSKKFTEEQYKELVRIQEDKFQDNVLELGFRGVSLKQSIPVGIRNMIIENGLHNKAIALMNPVTREWAHDKFVEKENQYVWNSKNDTRYGDSVRLYKDDEDDISHSIVEKQSPVQSYELLTLSEVADSIYDINKFDKEEV